MHDGGWRVSICMLLRNIRVIKTHSLDLQDKVLMHLFGKQLRLREETKNKPYMPPVSSDAKDMCIDDSVCTVSASSSAIRPSAVHSLSQLVSNASL
jgi:hypothetical protein